MNTASSRDIQWILEKQKFLLGKELVQTTHVKGKQLKPEYFI